MKYLLLDIGSRAIISYSQDPRVSTALKSAILDLDVKTLFPNGRFKDIYSEITDDNLKDNLLSFKNNQLDLITDVTIQPALEEKKALALSKKRAFIDLFNMTKLPLAYSSYFITPYCADIFRELSRSENQDLLNEYIEVRSIDKDEALKEINLKVHTYNVLMIKLQAVVDYYTEKLTVENNIDKIKILNEELLARMNIWNNY